MTRFALLVLGLALIGCDVFGGSVELGQLQTDASAYTAHVDETFVRFEVPVTYENATGRTVYLTGCSQPNPPSVEKRVGGEWVSAYASIVPACLAPPVPVGAGETFGYTLQAAAAVPGRNAAPEWEVETIPGTYRLRWWVEVRGEERTITSNTFELSVGVD